jgi:hypothetical protein
MSDLFYRLLDLFSDFVFSLKKGRGWDFSFLDFDRRGVDLIHGHGLSRRLDRVDLRSDFGF